MLVESFSRPNDFPKIASKMTQLLETIIAYNVYLLFDEINANNNSHEINNTRF